MFTDRVQFKVFAGKGGPGVVSWRKEKYIPKGGPFGGNGGKGGSVFVQTAESYYCLGHLRHVTKIAALNGSAGGTNNCRGKDGDDVIISVPCGTLLKDADSGEVLFDFTEKGQSFCLCLGGKGGKGNSFFKNSVRRAPAFATDGKEGESREIELELKLIADVGLVGMPNAGKSSLHVLLTHSEAKIAPYPFTTLVPNIGHVAENFVLADIPGIIAGAHMGKGLGLNFLRHIERTRILLFILDAAKEYEEVISDFQCLMEELVAYRADILSKPISVVLNKMDQPEAEAVKEKFLENYPFDPESLFAVSAKTGQGVAPLVNFLNLKLSKYTIPENSAMVAPTGQLSL